MLRKKNLFAKYDFDCTIVTILYMIYYTVVLECISFSIICTFRKYLLNTAYFPLGYSVLSTRFERSLYSDRTQKHF